MQKNVNVKAIYKNGAYQLGNNLPDEQAIKSEIIARQIKGLTDPKDFQIQYQHPIFTLQEAYKKCVQSNKDCLKINIVKNKKKKRNTNKKEDQSCSLNSKESERIQIERAKSIEYILPENNTSKIQSEKQSLKKQDYQIQNYFSVQSNQSQINTKKCSENFQQDKLIFKSVFSDKNQGDFIQTAQNHEFLNVNENIPKSPKNQFEFTKNTNRKIYSQPIEQNMDIFESCDISLIQGNIQENSCSNCKPNNIQKEFNCLNYQTQIQKKIIHKIISDLLIMEKIEKIEQKLNLIQKIPQQKIENKMDLMIQKFNEQDQKILNLTTNNNKLKKQIIQLINEQQRIILKVNSFTQIEKNYKVIDNVNIKLQKKFCDVQEKIEEINQKIHQIESQLSNLALPSSLTEKNLAKILNKLQSIQKNQVKNSMKEIQSEIKSPCNSASSFKPSGKKFDADIKVCQQRRTLKIGEKYSPSLLIQNIGYEKWPSKVYIKGNLSKRKCQIQSLQPGKHCLFNDDTFFQGKEQGQYLQVKYQLLYQEKGRLQLLCSSKNIFVKVAAQIKGEGEQNWSEQNSNQNDPTIKAMDSQKSTQKNAPTDQKQRTFLKMIKELKKKFNTNYLTIKEIKLKMEELGVNKDNFEETDPDIIEDIVINFDPQASIVNKSKQ